MSKQSDLVSVSQGASGDPLFVDAANNRVGIGTSSPTARLTTADGFMSFVSADANGYARFTATEANAQLGLFRSGSSAGGGYLGANSDASFIAYDGSFTERMRIDTAGRVTMPYQPAFQTNGAGYSLVANEIYAIRPSALFNTGGHYNVVNGRFTAPVTGKYKFHFLFTTATSGAAAPSLYFRRNGSGAHGRVLNYYAQYSSTSAHVVFDLNAGDFVEAIIEPWNSAAVVVWETSWGGYLIG